MRVYFRVEDFVRLSAGEPLPIAGEVVEVSELIPGEGKSPRASVVRRTSSPPYLQGTVKSFDAAKGWGFHRARLRRTYFLHRSDLDAALHARESDPLSGSTQGQRRVALVPAMWHDHTGKVEPDQRRRLPHGARTVSVVSQAATTLPCRRTSRRC